HDSKPSFVLRFTENDLRQASVVPRGDRPRHYVPPCFYRLRPRHRGAAATKRGLLHAVKAQAVVEQHLALGRIGHVLSPEQGGDGPGVWVAVVARLAHEERVEVQVVRGEYHRVLADVVDEERDELVAGLAAEEHAAALDVLARLGRDVRPALGRDLV